MKLDQLHCFQEACKYHSISVAAEKNYISQPSFSSAITKLEKELGVTLLNRTSRGVSPTPIGVVILEKVQGIFELVEDIQSVATAHSSYGTVQLATIPDLCDKILPISAQLAKAKKLNLQLTVHTAESDEIYHSVLSGVDSLGVVFFSTRVQSPELRFTPLFEDEYVLCVGPQSPYWDAESITIAEAMQQPYITYRDEFIKNNGGVSDVFKGMTPNIVLRTDDIESIKKLISHDNYVAFFHRHMNSDDIYRTSDAIRAIPFPTTTPACRSATSRAPNTSFPTPTAPFSRSSKQLSATVCRMNPSRSAINDRRFQTKMNSSPAQVSCVGLLFFYALYSPLICSASRAPSRT